MIIFAHRGYSSKYPENTMLAFEKAYEAGARAFECDVQLTKDNKMVVIHDESLLRTTGIDGMVSDYTLEELQGFDFSYKGKFNNFDSLKIPELKELLEYCKENKVLLNIELKNSIIDYTNLEQMVLDEVKKYGDYDNTIYSSFNHESVKRLLNLDPNIKAAPLFDSEPENMLEYLKALNTKGLHPGIVKLTPELKIGLETLHKLGYYINIYTVNDLELAKSLCEIGVDGIFTDYCEDMINHFNKQLSYIKKNT